MNFPLSAQELDSRLRNEPKLLSVMRLFKREAWLVGGYLRDFCLTGKGGPDLDFVVSGSHREACLDLRDSLGGTLVDRGGGMASRLALSGGLCIDISSIQGVIWDDLPTRDYTMNSMAWSEGGGLVDPLGGVADILASRIRANSRGNLQADPLRILRAYRFTAELGFSIDENTRGWIRDLKAELKRPASERITLEFAKLVSGRNAQTALLMASEDEALSEIIFNDNGVLLSFINELPRLQRDLQKVSQRFYLKSGPLGMTAFGVLIVEGLLRGARGHMLTLGRHMQNRLDTVNISYDEFLTSSLGRTDATFDLFERAGSVASDLLVLTRKTHKIGLLEAYGDVFDFPLVSAEDIMTHCGVGPGPALGALITQARRLQFAHPDRDRLDLIESLTPDASENRLN